MSEKWEEDTRYDEIRLSHKQVSAGHRAGLASLAPREYHLQRGEGRGKFVIKNSGGIVPGARQVLGRTRV